MVWAGSFPIERPRGIKGQIRESFPSSKTPKPVGGLVGGLTCARFPDQPKLRRVRLPPEEADVKKKRFSEELTCLERILRIIDRAAKEEGESRSGFLAHAALDYLGHRPRAR